MAERTAHNGLVVGSNPSKLKIKLNYYKFLKIKTSLKKNKLIVFYNTKDLNSKIWFAAKKLLKNLNLKYFRLQNKITKKILNQSIFKKFKPIISNTIIIGTFKIVINLVFSTFFITNNFLTFLAIKLNKTFYLLNQIKNIQLVKYKIVISIFYTSLKKTTKLPIKII